MYQQPNKKRKRIISTLAVLAIVLLIVVATSLSTKKKMMVHTGANNMTANTNTANKANATATTNTHTNGYRDGKYTATGSYDSPGGTEQLTVEVTLQNGVITATSAQPGASDPESAMFESQFISGYQPLVLGKNIADVRLSRVSGSSLTSQGFNDALEQIQKQAQQNT